MKTQPLGRYVAVVLAAVAFALATACSTLTGDAADTFNKKALAGYATVEFVGRNAVALNQQGKLSPADKDNVVNANRAAIAGLDLARSAYRAACPGAAPDCKAPTADAKLAATLTVLNALQAYLVTQGATVP